MEYVGTLIEIAHRLVEIAAANVVAADDELIEVVEVEAVKQRRRGDEARCVGEPARKCGQAKHCRRTDAAMGANEPKTDATLSHLRVLSPCVLRF